ncbi:MAG: DUF4142 domain-containing protein [Nitrospiraceae bacterium]
MRSITLSLCAIAVSAILVSGCVDEPGTPHVTLMRPSMTDADLLTYLAAADTGEIEEGRLARQRAATEDVQAYGERMIQEHRSLLDQAKGVAGLNLAADAGPKGARLLSEHVSMMETFKNKTGLAFDTAYLEHTIMVHQMIIRTMDRAAQERRQAAVQRVLDDARPVLQRHLETARALQRTIVTGH